MKNAVKLLLTSAVLIFLSVSCQNLFTTSVFSNYQTDFSTMNDAQKISYAEDLLISGSEEELEEAYEQIAGMLDGVLLSSTDLTEDELALIVLGADLALGASGVGSAVTDAIDALASADDSTDPALVAETIMNGFDEDDYSSLEDAVELISTAENNGVYLSPQQYSNAAAAQLLVVLNDVENLGVADPSSLDSDVPAQAAVIADLEQALLWADAGGLDPSILGDGIEMPAP